MIELRDSTLHFSFPELHVEARCSLTFQRTLRVPDDDQDYPLPAGLGHFPVWPVDDFDVPAHWHEHGGVFFPMYASEAMWISLTTHGRPSYPFALKIAAGKINAITGAPWTNELSDDPQDYLVIPEQPWLDGFNVAEGIVRQFVATRLGEGHTAEEQLTADSQWGGLQVIAYPMKLEAFRDLIEVTGEQLQVPEAECYLDIPAFSRKRSDEMGLAPGGRIKQEITEDPYGLDVWDTSVHSRCFVHLLNAEAFEAITGHRPPTRPITPAQYREFGIPWFDYYHEGPRLPGSGILSTLDGLAARFRQQGKTLERNTPTLIGNTLQLKHPSKGIVKDGRF